MDTDPNPFRYCGEYWDTHAEELYLRARTYNPANGRFSQEDSVKYLNRLEQDETVTDPFSLNLYGYAGNNPSKYKDSSGNFVISALVGTILIGAAIGAVSSAISGGVAAALNGEDILVGAVGGAVTGAIMGGVGATGAGVGIMMVTGAVTSGINSAVQQYANKGEIDIVEVGIDTAFGALSGLTSFGMNKAIKSLAAGDANPKLVDGLLQYMQFLGEEPLKYALGEMGKKVYHNSQSSKPSSPPSATTNSSKPKPPSATSYNTQGGSYQTMYYSYTVQPGDSFWSIAERYYGNGIYWQEIQRQVGRTWIDPGDNLVIARYQ